MNADFKQDGNLTVGDKVYKDKVLEVQVSLNINPEPVTDDGLEVENIVLDDSIEESEDIHVVMLSMKI